MFISKSNQLIGRTMSVSSGASSDLPSNLTNSDFSRSYTASGSTFNAAISNVQQVSYVAVSCSNVAGRTVTVFDGGSPVGIFTPTRNHVLMFNFELRDFSLLQVRITGGTGVPTIQHIAAGSHMEVPNGGEVSGYRRNWLGRSFATRSVSNDSAAPVAMLQKRQPLSGSLSLPNMTSTFTSGELQEFFDFAASGEIFYINEQAGRDDNLANQSYACFSPTLQSPTANSQTRALNDVRLNFRCYNGL